MGSPKTQFCSFGTTFLSDLSERSETQGTLKKSCKENEKLTKNVRKNFKIQKKI